MFGYFYKVNQTQIPPMAHAQDNVEMYMQRCLELASQGIQDAAPNPMVGSVIVHDGKIIGEGYHMKYGEPHAEVNAINSVEEKSLLKESTLYVNLEPCAHYGKTPPCSLLIIEHKIPKVFIGCVDTFSEVSGKGIEMMKDAGVKVITGILEDESRYLNRRFFTFHEKKRPFIWLKWAETLDGFIDRERSASEPASWITDEVCRMMVHKMRTEESAIMVGTETAFKDNPSLNVREWAGKNPTRIVLDKNLRLPPSHHLFDETQPTLVYTSKTKEKQHNIEFIAIDFTQNIIEQLLADLHQRNLLSVIVEGGSQLLQSFIDANLWDEAWKFVGPSTFGKGIKGPIFSRNPLESNKVGNSQLFVYQNILI